MRDKRARSDEIFDAIGIGFGPSNLALAICAQEHGVHRAWRFFEQHPQIDWHPGLLFEGARMQISFLKDLVSLRNPASPFSFLSYAKARGRLEHFINLNQFRPTRLEYQDYLRWTASHFTDQVCYGTAVRRVTPVAGPTGAGLSRFRVEVEHLATQTSSVHFARNVVCAVGGRPRRLAHGADQAPGVVHASEFLLRFPALFPHRAQPYVFAVVGAGESAGEIAAYLLERYDRAQVHLVISGYALRCTDANPFVNEQFFRQSTDDFFHYSEAKRAALLQELHGTNNGAIHEDLLDQLYNTAYLDAVKGRQRLFLHTCARLQHVRAASDGLYATIADRFDGPSRTLRSDGVVLATGYERSLDAAMFGDVIPFLVKDAAGGVALTRSCRVQAAPELVAGLYSQGQGEGAFGLGDRLLSILPFRSQSIFDDIRASTPPSRTRSDSP